LAGNLTPSGWSDDDAGEAVAVVPGGVGDFTGSNVGTAGAVTFVVVGVGVDPIAEQAVVAAGLITCISSVATLLFRASLTEKLAAFVDNSNRAEILEHYSYDGFPILDPEKPDNQDVF
jgi:hypothetical protein